MWPDARETWLRSTRKERSRIALAAPYKSFSLLGLLCLLVLTGCMRFSLPDLPLSSAPQPPAFDGKLQNAEGLVPVLISFAQKPNAPETELVLSHGGRIKYIFRYINAIAAFLPPTALEVLRSLPQVIRIEPDSQVRALGIEENNSWGVVRINAPAAHSLGYTGSGVKVAVIDSGIDYTHPDLAHAYRGGYDFVNQDPDPMDDNGHGTHVAGVIAAKPNGIGVLGVAPDVDLYALKVLDRTGAGYWSDVIAAIEWAIDQGIQVVNLSIGGDGAAAVEAICRTAYDRGLLLVAAAGNGGTTSVIAPACYPSVIAVGATDQNDRAAPFSPNAPELELVAPGTTIYSTLPGGSYGVKSGTSMACPHVAGVAALIWSANSSLPNQEVRNKLAQTAVDLGAPGRDTSYGFGLVHAARAVGAEVASITVEIQPPSAELTTTKPSVTLTAKVTGGKAPYRFEWYKDGARISGASEATYTASQPGEYCVKVTDSLSSTATSGIAKVTKATPSQPVLRLGELTLSYTKNRTSVYATAKVRVVDASGNPVSRATVTAYWSYNGVTKTVKASTNTQGYVTFRSPTLRNGQNGLTFSFYVTSINKTGWIYDPAENEVEPCATISVP